MQRPERERERDKGATSARRISPVWGLYNIGT